MPDLWPLVLTLCLLSPPLVLCQDELQWVCSQPSGNRADEGCQMFCRCRPNSPLPPPPPPPPPPPRPPLSTAGEASVPLSSSWWMDIIVVGTTGSALAVFLLLTLIICFKAMKRKPLTSEKKGPSCGDDGMSSFKKTNDFAV